MVNPALEQAEPAGIASGAAGRFNGVEAAFGGVEAEPSVSA